MSEAPCAKCGSTKVIPRVRAVARFEHYSHDLQLSVQRNPEAFVLKGEERIDTYARVCGECGFMELFAKDPPDLYRAYVESKK